MALRVRCCLRLNPENLCLNKKQLNDIVKDTLNDTKLFVSQFHSEVSRFPVEKLQGQLSRVINLSETINSVNGDTFPVYTRFFYKYLFKTYHQMLLSEEFRSDTFTRHTGQSNVAEGLDLILCIRKAIGFINAIEQDKALDFAEWYECVWCGTRTIIMIEAFKRYGKEEPLIENIMSYSKEYKRHKNTDKFEKCIDNDLKIMFSVLKGLWIELGTQGHSVPKFFKTLLDKYCGSSWEYELDYLYMITSLYDCDLNPDITDPPVSETSSEEPSIDEDPSQP